MTHWFPTPFREWIVRANQPRPGAKPRKSAIPVVLLFLAGAGMAVLLFSTVIVLWLVLGRTGDATERQAEGSKPVGAALPSDAPSLPQTVTPSVAPPTAGAWWDALAQSHLAETVALLRLEMPQDEAMLDRLGNRADTARQSAYRDLLAKLPELIRRPEPKRLLSRFLSDCYALDPADANVAILQSWLVKQLPEENAAFPPALKSDDLERSFWALEATLDALMHPAIRPERRTHLAAALGTASGLAIDPAAPAKDLKADVEQQLAKRCYRKLAPTASASLDQALALRQALLRVVPQYLPPKFRAKRDVEIALDGLPQAVNSWSVYSALVRDCLRSDEPTVLLGVVDVYAKADGATAAKLEPILASRWSAAEDSKLNQDAKVRAIRKTLGIPDPAERLEVLAKVARDARAVDPNPANVRNATLQEAARLTHAATLASALWQKQAGLARFDALVAQVPVLGASGPPAATDTSSKTAAPSPAGPAVAAGPQPIIIRQNLARFGQRNTHPVALKGGRTYAIHMVSNFHNSLSLYSTDARLIAQDDDSGGGLNALIRFTAPIDTVYRLVACAYGGRAAGPYTITIQEVVPGAPPMMARRPAAAPPMVIQPPAGNTGQPPATPVAGNSETLVEQADLAGLTEKNPSATRIAAMNRIAAALPADLAHDDLAARPAQAIARYLLTIKTNAELEEVLGKIAPFAKSRAMLLALADRVDQDAEQQATEAVVGRLVGQPLRFAKDDPWRLTCRRLLLRQMLSLDAATNPGNEAAGVIRNLYAEQAALLGVDPAGIKEITRPSLVLEKIIEHVAAGLGNGSLAKEDKDFLDGLPDQLFVAKFLAQNDLDHHVLLQRAWVRLLPIFLAQQLPERAGPMREVYQQLADTDRLARTILEQLRSGEREILRVWAIALDLK